MPIGVPRIIYCWGEELPAQWTDIYNFIFRRRMVFLMQYLDDELCNQICGLLINIHMEDRSKELEKKEMERSGVFKSGTKSTSAQGARMQQNTSFYNKKSRSMEDLLNADEDLGIDEIDTLEQYTLQKITAEWLNWNAQFFDYSDEPYLYYLAELLSKDFNKNQSGQQVDQNTTQNGTEASSFAKLLNVLKNQKGGSKAYMQGSNHFNALNKGSIQMGEVYSPFRTNANFSTLQGNSLMEDENMVDFKQDMLFKQNLFFGEKATKKQKLLQMFQDYQNFSNKKEQKTLSNLLANLAQDDFSSKLASATHFTESSQKILGQRNLRCEYNLERNFDLNSNAMQDFLGSNKIAKSFNYLDPFMANMQQSEGKSQTASSQSEFRDYYRKQTERTLMEEESKKVFVIINSFGGSVGNGITVHDALQFIKAGSLTLALGVAASAASLALAGGTIGERYVTEGCHVMIHQPESGGLQGQASDIWIDSQEIMKIRLDVAEIYSLSTYRPRHKILRDLDRDFYLTATETIQYGLADEIATNEVMASIVEEVNRVWDYHDSKQQRLLETRESASSGLDTQTQN
jgi:ATP-dependent Clp protease protease subunit